MNTLEKLAYLKGLVEGLALDETKKDTKVINNLINLLEDVVMSVTTLEDDVAEIQQQLDEVDEDLGEIEKEFYSDDCDCDCCCDDDDCDCDCCDDECLEVECPACENTVCIGFDEIDDNGEAECPACGAILEFEIEEEDEIEE